MNKILIIGAGYVGLSNAILLSQKFDVTITDIDKEKINLINKKKSPFNDKKIEYYLSSRKLNLSAKHAALINYDVFNFIFIALPTDYVENRNSFNTKIIETTIKKILNISPYSLIIIRSTLPIGFCENISKILKTERIIYFPEFLREGQALEDSLNPSRIIIGGNKIYSIDILNLFTKCIRKKNISNLITTSSEAEAIKLFSNTFLAMRISFFNELDTFCLQNKIDSKKVISGVSLDKRIGNYYNNPSFGYGGYCLPKDTKQLLSNFDNIPQDLIKATVNSNNSRKSFISKYILGKKKSPIGIYRLSMKTGSDNFRNSSILDIIKLIKKNKKIKIYIYEPLINDSSFMGIEVFNKLHKFKKICNLIIANRFDSKLDDIEDKVISRDLFREN